MRRHAGGPQLVMAAGAPLDPATLARVPLRMATPDDRHVDSRLVPYAPRRPLAGKARGDNLLWQSLAASSARAALGEPLLAVQRALGPGRVVWSVTAGEGGARWGLHLQDPASGDATELAAATLSVLAPWVVLPTQVAPSVPLARVDLELTLDSVRQRRIAAARVHLAGARPGHGSVHAVTPEGLAPDGEHGVFEAKREAHLVLAWLKASPQLPPRDPRALASVLAPELFAARRIAVCRGSDRDALEYAGVAVDQLRWFLRRFGHAAALRAFVDAHEERLDHLEFDVRVEFRLGEAGRVTFPATSFYGVL